jgi:hypothetical protein
MSRYRCQPLGRCHYDTDNSVKLTKLSRKYKLKFYHEDLRSLSRKLASIRVVLSKIVLDAPSGICTTFFHQQNSVQKEQQGGGEVSNNLKRWEAVSN